MDREAIIEELGRALSREGPDVVAAWLFGSVARATARPDSDVDVAILSTATEVGLPLDLADRLGRLLGRTVQVVDAARAPADLVHRVLRDGILLLDRDPARRVRFEVEARNRYFDMTPIWREYRTGAAR